MNEVIIHKEIIFLSMKLTWGVYLYGGREVQTPIVSWRRTERERRQRWWTTKCVWIAALTCQSWDWALIPTLMIGRRRSWPSIWHSRYILRARTHILSLYAFFPFLQPSICFFWLFLSFHFKCSALRCSPSLIDTGALMIALNKAWLNPLD